MAITMFAQFLWVIFTVAAVRLHLSFITFSTISNEVKLTAHLTMCNASTQNSDYLSLKY